MENLNNDTVDSNETAQGTKKAKRAPMNYPFRTKAQIVALVERDDAFMLQCLVVLYDRQTQFEQDQKTTLDRNARGFMSSHSVNGSILAVAAAERALTTEEIDKARSIVVRYGKQLAAHFRAEEINSNPDLAQTGAVFGV